MNTEEKPNLTINIPTNQGVYALTHNDRPTDGHLTGKPADSSASIMSVAEHSVSQCTASLLIFPKCRWKERKLTCFLICRELSFA